MPWNSNHHTKITKNIYAVMKSYRVLFFPYIFLLLNKTTGKRIQHQVYIEKAYPVYNQDIVKTLHRKGIMNRKREGMLTDGSKLRWMKTIKALTEWIANWRHARPKKKLKNAPKRYEHAPLEPNREEQNRTGRFTSKLCFTDQMGVLAYLIRLQSHLSKTKLYIYFFFLFVFSIEFTISKTKI